MIHRVWRGWTSSANADAYERLLRAEVIPGISAMKIPGYRGLRLLRRRLPSGEFEFMTIMRFDSIECVKSFVGEDHERAHVPDAARRLLARFDERSAHYDELAESEP